MTRTLAAEVQKPKLVSRGQKPLPSGGGSSRHANDIEPPEPATTPLLRTIHPITSVTLWPVLCYDNQVSDAAVQPAHF